MASLVFRQPVERNVNATGIFGYAYTCQLIVYRRLQGSKWIPLATPVAYIAATLCYMVNQVAGTQVVDKVAGAQVMDQVAGVQVVLNQVAGTQVLDQVGRAQVLDQVT